MSALPDGYPNELPIPVSTNGVKLRAGNTYLFKSSVGALSATIAFATDPSMIGIVDIDGMSDVNNITLTVEQGNKLTYNNAVDTAVIVDVPNWSGTLIFDNADFLWNIT